MNRRRLLIMVVTALIAVPLLIVACTTPAPEPSGDDGLPVIHSLAAEAEKISPAESIEIACIASASDGGGVTYQWWANGGVIEGEGPTITWRAPDTDGLYQIRVTVRDGRGGEATASLSMTVEAEQAEEPNQPPVINSLTATANWTTPAASLEVICDAEDYDGHPLSYEWSASAGHFQGTGPQVTWTAPEAIGMCEIAVAVSDGYGGMATATLPITVMPAEPPNIEALVVTAVDHRYIKAYPPNYKVGRGQVFHVECFASDTGVELFYEWSCTGGEISGEGSLITWTSPDQTTTVRVTVVVSDIVGRTDTRSVDLDVVSCSEFG
jgi:hypothetical protein